jgi:hypothetical protein
MKSWSNLALRAALNRANKFVDGIKGLREL